MTTLKSCPFCGGVEGDTVALCRDLNGWAAGCTDGCRIEFMRATKEEAVVAWNTRVNEEEETDNE